MLGPAVWALAALSGARAAVGYLVFGATLTPDTGLYAAGGIGLFPSPFGRAIGNLGEPGIAALNVVACVLLVVAVAQGAAKVGGRPWLAALVVVACPLSWWTMFAGVDTIAAALIVAGFAHGRGALPVQWFAAVLFHLQALLVVLSYLIVAHRRLALWLAVGGLALCLATPYRGLVLDLSPFVATTSALVTVLVFALCMLPLFFSGRVALVMTVPAIAGGALSAGLCASAAFETNMRYMLPAVAIGAMWAGRARVPRLAPLRRWAAL